MSFTVECFREGISCKDTKFITFLGHIFRVDQIKAFLQSLRCINNGREDIMGCFTTGRLINSDIKCARNCMEM